MDMDELQRLQLQLKLQSVATDISIAVLKLIQSKRKRRTKRREVWTKPWLLQRPTYGQHGSLMKELAIEDPNAFKDYLRIPQTLFQEILERIGPHIEKKDTNWRKPLSPGLRLAITLRYLATGDSYKSLQYAFRVAHNTISLIVPETCKALIAVYGDEVLSCPKTPAEWKEVADLFSEKWKYHNTLGALDAKHVAIGCPRKEGSKYYNYRGFHSIVLLGLVDADYKFLYVDVGSPGASSGGAVFSATSLWKSLEEDPAFLPPRLPLPNDDVPVPYHIIGDDSFPMRPWLLKSYAQRKRNREERIFNYRLSRARRVAENAFGIMASRFKCLLSTFPLDTKRVESVVLACCCLHNLVQLRNPTENMALVDAEDPESHELIPGSWRNGAAAMVDMEVLSRNNATQAAKRVRDQLRQHYSSPSGSVPWQDAMI